MGDHTRLRAWERALLVKFPGTIGRSLSTALSDVRVTARHYTGSGLYVDFEPIQLSMPGKVNKARGPDFRVLPDPRDEIFLSVLVLENGTTTGLEVAACGLFALPEGELDIEFA